MRITILFHDHPLIAFHVGFPLLTEPVAYVTHCVVQVLDRYVEIRHRESIKNGKGSA